MAQDAKPGRQRIYLELSVDLVAQIDELKGQFGHRSRGALLEQLLRDLFPAGDDPDSEQQNAGVDLEGSLHESGALVLVTSHQQGLLVLDRDPEDPARPEVVSGTDPWARTLTPPGQGGPSRAAGGRPAGGSGIDLPGFVRQSSARLRQSLHPPQPASPEPLPGVDTIELDQALAAVQDHWLGLYGTEANEAVLEASMLWLAQEIWPQSDQAEGRPFTWSLLEQWISGFVSGWLPGPPDFARVVVAAGLLEDPFSAGTLTLRIPTLIRRFVHRFRRRRHGTSFQTLEHTMTLQGALRLLDLPTAPGHKLSLSQIREAYREQAMSHHPDSGGSADAMRRLNEAYQLLKELYRRSA